jgi:hypothetical protein
VDGEVVDALLGLLDQRVAEDLPGQVFGLAVDLLQRLVDRHGADRHRRVAHDPLAGFVDVLAGGQVHHRVAAPADRPHHLLDFLGDRRVTAELPMLALIFTRKLRPMIIGSSSGWLMLAGMMARPRATSSRTNSGVISAGMLAPKLLPGGACRCRLVASMQLGALVLADGDVLHLRRDDPLARVVHLRDVAPGLGAQRLAVQAEAQVRELVIGRRGRPKIEVGPFSSSVSPRSSIHGARSGASPGADRCTSIGSRPGRCTGPRCRSTAQRRVLLANGPLRRSASALVCADLAHRHAQVTGATPAT